jgi:putative transposase
MQQHQIFWVEISTQGIIGKKWVSDLTYIRTREGWLYLTTIMDLADRKIVGWELSETMDGEQTTIATWQMAIKNCSITAKLIFHSGKGCIICLQ